MRAVLARVAAVIGLSVVFATSLVVGVLLHLGLPPSVALVRDQVNAALGGAFVGTLTIDEVTSLSVLGLEADAHLEVEAKTVIAARGVRARYSLPAVLAALVGGRPLPIARVEVDAADVSLESDVEGELLIAKAFEPTESDAPPSEGPPPVVGVVVHEVWLGQIRAHRVLQGEEVVAHLTEARGRVRGVAPVAGATRIELDAATLSTAGLGDGLDLMGVAAGALEVDDVLSGEVRYAGLVGVAPIFLHASAEADGGEALTLVTAPVPAGPLARLLPALRADASVVLSARAWHRRGHAQVDAGVAVVGQQGPPGTLRITAAGEIGELLSAQVRFDLDAIDLSQLLANGPSSALAAHGVLGVRLPVGGDEPLLRSLDATAELSLEPGALGGQRTPALQVYAELAGGSAHLEASVVEPGLFVELGVDATLREPLAARFDVVARSPDLRAIERVELPVGGSASARASGRVILADEGPRVTANVGMTMGDVRLDGVSAQTATVEATLEGRLADPEVSARLVAGDLRRGEQGFGQVVATVEGRLNGARVVVDATGGRDARLSRMHAEADVRLDLDRSAVRVTGGRVEARVGGETVRGRLGSLSVMGGRVSLEGIEVEGAGVSLDAAVDIDAAGLALLVAKAGPIHTDRIARLLDLPPGFGGVAHVDVDLRRTSSGLDGFVRASVRNGHAWRLRAVGADVDLRSVRGALTGSIFVEAPRLGTARLTVNEARPSGAPTSLDAWRGVTGRAVLDGRVQVASVGHLLEELGVELPAGLGRSHGELLVAATAARDRRGTAPTVNVRAELRDAAVVTLPGGAGLDLHGAAEVARQLGALEAHLALDVTPQTGDAALKLALRDPRGALAHAEARVDVPYARLWDDRLRRVRSTPVESWLGDAPLHVAVTLPGRRLEELPRSLGLVDTSGTVTAELTLDGTLRAPRIAIEASAERLRSPRHGLPIPTFFEVVGSWERGVGDVKAQVAMRRGRVARGHARVEADLGAYLTGRPPARPLEGGAHLELCRVPLRLVGAITGVQLAGWLTGDVVVEGLNTSEVRYTARVQGHEVEMAGVEYSDVRLDLEGDGELLEARARVEQEDGFGAVAVKLPVDTVRGVVVPRVREADLTLTAKDLDLRGLQPFVEGAIEELGGRLDADARLRLGADPLVRGSVSVREGRLQIASFGDTFVDVDAKVVLSDGGVKLEKLTARNGGGRVSASGDITLSGLRPGKGRIEVHIDEGEAIPVILQGQRYGDAHGRIAVDAELRDEGLTIDVDVQSLDVALGRTLPGGVQALDPAEHVHIGTFDPRGRLRAIALSPPAPVKSTKEGGAILVRVALNDAVRLRRGTLLGVRLGGEPEIEITDEARVRGEIRLLEGEIDVQGKTFEVRSGVITFTDRPPDNPLVVATARWTAPEGTEVFADFAGPVATGEVTLRSDPPLAKSQILSLILFGRTDEQVAVAGAEGNEAGSAAGVGGSLVAEGLNAAIEDLTSLDLTARIDSSRPGRTAAQLELRVARQLSLAYSHVLGLPPPGQNPDRNFATLEWRFRRHWALETTVGDAGSTSMDVFWERRY